MLSRFMRFIFILSTGIFLLSCTNETQQTEKDREAVSFVHEYYKSIPFEYSILEPGDFILRKGRGMVSDYIVGVLNEEIPVSHCGILVESDGEWNVVHAISKDGPDNSGVIEESLLTFIRESLEGTLVIVRLKAEEDLRLSISEQARELATLNIPFDYSFNIEDNERMYCTEVVWSITTKVLGTDLFDERVKPGEVEILRFTNFFDEQKFEMVLNHFASL